MNTKGGLNVLLVMAALSPALIFAHHLDPSDVTQLNTSLTVLFEEQRVKGNQATSAYAQGRYAFSKSQVSAELGYGRNQMLKVSDFNDLQLSASYQAFNRRGQESTLAVLNYSLDVTLPLSGYERGLSYGYRVISPSITGAFLSSGGGLEYYPQLTYHYAKVENERLKSALESAGLGRRVEQFRIDVGISPKFDTPFYVLFSPGYAWGAAKQDDRTYLQVKAGVFLLASSSLEIVAHYNFRKGQTLETLDGEGNVVRLSWNIYF